MATDYETEKTAFRDFYDASRSALDAANEVPPENWTLT